MRKFVVAAAVAVALIAGWWVIGELRLRSIRTGLTSSEVIKRAGEPAYAEELPLLADPYLPRDPLCRGAGITKTFVYRQYGSVGRSLLVYFDGSDRVRCVERLMVFRRQH
jgi:hypothetical protein